VGCGAVTELYYAPALAILEQEQMLQVAGLSDPDRERAREIGGRFPRAQCTNDYEALLEQDIDLVIVASPPVHHAEQSIRALQSGKSVLCEKPLATTTADARRMAAAAAEAGRFLAAGYVRRCFPAARTIKAAFDRGMLGTLRRFQCFEGGTFRWPVHSGAYFQRKEGAGGVLLDLGPHVFDLLVWWLGPPIAIRYEDDAMGGVEANCRIELDYAGFTGEIRLSRDWDRPNRYVFQGSQGWLSWVVNEADAVDIGFPETGYAAAARLHDVAWENETPVAGGAAANFHQCFVEQLRNVLAFMRGDTAPVVSGADVLESVRLVEHCYRHRTPMPMPWLDDGEQRNARRQVHG
jgi:predicted dehydrogenase